MRLPHGLTTIELTIAVALLGLILTVALPVLGRFIDEARIRRAHMALVESFLHGGRAAVGSGVRSVMCPRAASGDCADSQDWRQGWLVFSDLDQDGHYGGEDTLLLRQEAWPDGLRIRSTPGRRRIVFHPQGDTAGTNLTLTLCGGQARASSVILSNATRMRLEPADEEAAQDCASG